MDVQTNRRVLLGAMALAPMAAAATLGATAPASSIEHQYRVWVNAYQADDRDTRDSAEEKIQASQEKSSRAAEIKLWVALTHMPDRRLNEQHVLDGNIAALTADEGLDWDTKLVVGAIASLRNGGSN